MILPDYLDHDLDVVFCGTAAGNKSAATKHYFADPNNGFWRVLKETGFTAELLTPERDHEMMRCRLGLTDLVKFHCGVDSDLRAEMYDIAGFESKMLRYKPRFVAFTSKQAAANYYGHGETAIVRYGLQDRQIAITQLFVLPSTSGLARRHWDEAPWRELAAVVRVRDDPQQRPA